MVSMVSLAISWALGQPPVVVTKKTEFSTIIECRAVIVSMRAWAERSYYVVGVPGIEPIDGFKYTQKSVDGMTNIVYCNSKEDTLMKPN